MQSKSSVGGPDFVAGPGLGLTRYLASAYASGLATVLMVGGWLIGDALGRNIASALSQFSLSYSKIEISPNTPPWPSHSRSSLSVR